MNKVTIFARRFLHYENISDDVGIRGGFFTVFGVIFAIVAGFLLVEVLGRYSTLTNTIESEPDAVECLRDYLVYLDNDQHLEQNEDPVHLEKVFYLRTRERVALDG